MIEDKEKGIKIAENPIEALWARTLAATEQRIIELENTLIIERAFCELAKEKLAKGGKETYIG